MPTITFDPTDSLLGPAMGGKRVKKSFWKRFFQALIASRMASAERELNRHAWYREEMARRAGKADHDYAMLPFNRDIA